MGLNRSRGRALRLAGHSSAAPLLLLAKDRVTQLALTLIGLRELRADPFHEGSQGAALSARTREDQMMADIADVGGTTHQWRH